ncbi:MAG: phosphatase PAP2 family protein [Bacteroidota bacterium]
MKYLPFCLFRSKTICALIILLFTERNAFAQQTNNFASLSPDFRKISDRTHKTTIIHYGNDTLIFKSPKLLSIVTNVPSDLSYIAKASFAKKNLPWLAAVTVSSVAMIAYDQKITDWIKQTSHLLGISANTSYNVLIKAGDTKVLQVPKNSTTAFYQLGQGGTSLFLAGGMWVYGKLSHDYRAVVTAADLANTFITMAITTQLIKRITGRESPYESSASGGKWRPFPSFGNYQKDTPKYDAFPSGHLATMMATITVLSENYPEKKWIQPVGYSLMGICMWTMANIEVHWVGDYPLALAIGYLSGKITTMRHKKKIRIAPSLF